MKIKLIALGIFIYFLFYVLSANSSEFQPTETIRATVNSVLTSLEGDDKKNPDKIKHCRSKIWENIKDTFDFHEISKRTLTRDWKNFTPSEQKNFSSTFGQFLGNIYLNKIQNEYSNESVSYVGEEFPKDSYSVVKTKIISNSIIIPIDYKLIKNAKGVWKIYDVVIEGVSLVANYRTQFKSILRKNTPAQLIEKLDQKLEMQKIEN